LITYASPMFNNIYSILLLYQNNQRIR